MNNLTPVKGFYRDTKGRFVVLKQWTKVQLTPKQEAQMLKELYKEFKNFCEFHGVEIERF